MSLYRFLRDATVTTVRVAKDATVLTAKAGYYTAYGATRATLWTADQVAQGVDAVSRLSALSTELQCSRGCPPQRTEGVQECGACHARFVGHILEPCPFCHAEVRYVVCSTCGIAIPNGAPR